MRELFKERFSIASRDHIMEQFIYEFATILGIQCCKAYCRKSNNMYGSFSRFEVVDLSNVIHYSNVTNKTDMLANELIDATIKLQGGINSFVVQLYQIIIFDYITAQHDRHLENLDIYRNNNYIWYPLYDNGLCCFSFEDNEHANNSLKRGFFQGRMGGSLEILETLNDYRDLIFKDDLRNLIKYNRVTKPLILNLLNKSDKYNQLSKERKIGIVNLIYKLTTDIHKLNLRMGGM